MHLYAPTQSNAPKAPSPGNRPYNAEAMSAWQPTFKEHCNTALSIGVAAIKRASGRYFPSKKHSGCPRRHSIAAERPATGKAQAEPRTERNQRPAIGEEPHPHGRPAARSGSCKRRAVAGRPIREEIRRERWSRKGSAAAQCIAHLVPRSQRLRPDTKHATRTPRPKGGWAGGRAAARPLCRAARSRPLP